MTINLAELSTASVADVTYDVELEHPVAGAIGLVVRVIGSHSPKVRAVVDQQVNAMLKANFETRRNKKSETPTVERSRKDNAELLAAATVEWFEKKPSEKIGGAPKIEQGFPFGDERLQLSEAAAVQLYSDPAFDWLYSQVNEAVGELANFMKS